MNILGLKIRGHDTGAALIADGRIVAIAEERLNRVKHSFEMFPLQSIDYCLDALGLEAKDIDCVVIDQVSGRWRADMKKIFSEHTGERFTHARIEIINHHDAHAASAFFCSPFKEAAVLVYDGSGELYRTHLGVQVSESETLYRGFESTLSPIKKAVHLRDGKSCPYTQGVGKLYSEITDYLNLGKYNEGKTMGLAPYGDDSLLKQIPPARWFAETAGIIVCNSRITYPSRALKQRMLERKGVKDFYTVAKGFLRMRIKRIVRPLVFTMLRTIRSDEMFVEPKIFTPIHLPRPKRDPQYPLPDKYYASVAFAVQHIFEQVAIRWGKMAKEITGLENLCVAGGCGLNIDANKKFFDEAGFRNVFIQPAASDTGIALGCALYGWHVTYNKPRFWVMQNAELGKKYSEDEILKAINDRKEQINVTKSPSIVVDAARLIAESNVIGWFYGGAEYGPRALGNRSILCDARNPDMRDIANKKVKHREPWRPFAASVLKENMTEWFELEQESPFMLIAANVVESKKQQIPSVVHVDGTCRIQSVTKDANGRYYELLSEFNKITGVPLLLDTSFNLAGDPIVETPADALDCFLKTKMDYLVLENYLVSKK